MQINNFKSNYKLISFDLDGTLLNDKLILTKPTIKGLNKIIDAGFISIINTGRNLKSVLNLIGNIKFSYLVCLNGALIFDNIKKEIIFSKKINKAAAEKIIKIIFDKKINANIFTGDSVYTTGYDKGINKKYQKLLNPVFIYDNNFNRINFDEIFSIELILNENNDVLKIIYKYFNKFIGIHNAGFNYYEITYKSIDKLNSLKLLLKKLKIKIKNVIAIGDSISDLSLIKKSGYSIAMKNSDPDLIKSADLITDGDNNKNGAINCLINNFIN